MSQNGVPNGVSSGVPAASPLDLSLADMRRLGYRVTDVVAEHLSTLRDQPTIKQLTRSQATALIASPPPAKGADFETLLDTLLKNVFPYAVREPHPGFIAYVPGCPTFPAIMGDWLATGWNFFAGVWPVASGPDEVELVVIDWFRRWLGMPDGSGGLLTSGGSAASVTAVIAARHQAVGDDWSRLPRLAMYASDQAHSAVTRAGWLAGIPRDNIRSIATDDDFRMIPSKLADAIAADRQAGKLPFLVGASAGTTSTGSVDPLHEIADLCARERLWLHVDAAYGGFAVLTERGRQALDGIGRADSVALDPHKWLFVPFECGSLVVRDPRLLSAAFAVHAEYLQDVAPRDEQVNFADYGEQLTRYARALKVWLGVGYFGTDALAAAMDRAMDLTLLAQQLLTDEPHIEILSPARFGVLCFRAHPAGVDEPAVLDALNERINARINALGPYYVSSTRIRGAFSLRICILGFRTAEEDVRGLVRAVAQLAHDEEARLEQPR